MHIGLQKGQSRTRPKYASIGVQNSLQTKNPTLFVLVLSTLETLLVAIHSVFSLPVYTPRGKQRGEREREKRM